MPCLPCRRAPRRSPGIPRGVDNRRTGLIGPPSPCVQSGRDAARAVRVRGRRRHRDLPVRAAGAAGAAVGERAPAVGGGRSAIVLGLATTFAITIVGLRQGRRRRRPRRLRAAHARRSSCWPCSAWRCWCRGSPTGSRRRCRGSRASARARRATASGPAWRVGAALGFVYAPCAGPILAAVISVGAASGHERGGRDRLRAGLGGRAAGARARRPRVLDRVRAAGRGPALQRALGVVMLVTARRDGDRRSTCASRPRSPITSRPCSSTRPARSSARTRSRRGSRELRGGGARFARAAARGDAARKHAAGARHGARLHRHPALVQHAGRQAADARGAARARRARRLLDLHVHQLHPHAALPARLGRRLPLARADDRRRPHARSSSSSTTRATCRRDRARTGIRYPVAQDNDYETWNAWGNQYWPAKYLIDAKGRVRYVHFGEGDDEKTEAAIRSLLAEAGAESLGGDAKVGPTLDARQAVDARDLPRRGARPGLGAEHAAERPRTTTPAPAGPLLRSRFAFTGRWKVDDESATALARREHRRATCQAKDVYLVLSSQGDRAAPVAGRARRQAARARSPCSTSACTRSSRSRRRRSTT